MKITKIETISLAGFPNVIWIEVHEAPDLGIKLKQGVSSRADATVKVSSP